MNKTEAYIKRQIRIAIASRLKIDNLNDVSTEDIIQAYESKRLDNCDIKMDLMEDGRTYFAFVDRDTGYFYNTAII